MISFVCWKWETPSSKRIFQSKHVNVLHAMIARHYPAPFRFICITDQPKGLDPAIESRPLPVRIDLPAPQGRRFPSCYSRLWNFSRDAVDLGERILQLDIDVIITGDLTPLVDRQEDFVGWCDDRFVWNKIAGGAYLLKTGSMPHIWEEFDPKISPNLAFSAGNAGSDQGWMSYRMYPPPGQWNGKDGLIKLGWTRRNASSPPKSARIVFTTGMTPPWNTETRRQYPWIKEFWRL